MDGATKDGSDHEPFSSGDGHRTTGEDTTSSSSHTISVGGPKREQKKTGRRFDGESPGSARGQQRTEAPVTTRGEGCQSRTEERSWRKEYATVLSETVHTFGACSTGKIQRKRWTRQGEAIRPDARVTPAWAGVQNPAQIFLSTRIPAGCKISSRQISLWQESAFHLFWGPDGLYTSG